MYTGQIYPRRKTIELMEVLTFQEILKERDREFLEYVKVQLSLIIF